VDNGLAAKLSQARTIHYAPSPSFHPHSSDQEAYKQRYLIIFPFLGMTNIVVKLSDQLMLVRLFSYQW